MKLKNLLRFGTALVVSISSLFVLGFGSALAVAQNCTWTGATDSNFNTAGNWSGCNSTVPQTGDNLIFDNSSLAANASINNNIVGLSVNSVTFSGNTNYNYTLTGNAMTVTGGISITSTSSAIGEFDMPLTLTGDQTISLSGGINELAFGSFSSPSTLSLGTSNITISGSSGDIGINDAISGSGSISTNLPLLLSGDNSSYTGNLTVSSGGELVANSTHPLGSGVVTVSGGGSLVFALPSNVTLSNNINLSGTGYSATIGTLKNSDGLAFGRGNGAVAGGKVTLSGTVTLSSDVTYSGDLATDITGTYTANGHTITVLSGNSGTITTPNGTAGAAKQTTTISSTDKSTASLSIGYNQTYILDGQRGFTLVGSGGLLEGTGTVGDLSVNTGGTVAPGHSPGCLSTGNLTLNGTYQAEIGGTTACSGYDQLKVTGTVNVTGATLSTSLYNSYKPKAGEAYTIISNDGSDAVTGTFANLPEGSTFTVNGYVFQITYKGGDGNDVVLTVKSVPSTPDTGFGLISANPFIGLGGATLAAGGFYGLSRRTKVLRKR